MNKNNFKSIVVLKNLPSNIVDEAIVILKPNKKNKKIEIIDKKNNAKTNNHEFQNNIHVVSEAEMIVNNYISMIEKKEADNENNNIFKAKYKRLKKYSLVSSAILIMSIILHFF